MSKVSPILVRYQYIGSGILSTTVHGSMVVNTANPYRSSPGSKRQRNLINSSFSQRNWRAETMGSGITSLCDGDDSLSCVERVRLRVTEKWNCCVLADCRGWVVNLFYCLCGEPLGLGSLGKGSWILGHLRQLPDGQKTSMGCEENGLG